MKVLVQTESMHVQMQMQSTVQMHNMRYCIFHVACELQFKHVIDF